MPSTASLEGLAVFLNGSLNSSKTRRQMAEAGADVDRGQRHLSTRRDICKLSLIDKLVGQQYSDTTDTTVLQAGRL